MPDSAHNPVPHASPAPAAPPSEAVALELGALEATLPARPGGTPEGEHRTPETALKPGDES